MTLEKNWKVAILWAFSLVAVAVASAWAQDRGRNAPVLQSPTVISGSDLGFRTERTMDGIQIGKLVVRINGVWVDTNASASVAP